MGELLNAGRNENAVLAMIQIIRPYVLNSKNA
jgi:hypothetical protein